MVNKNILAFLWIASNNLNKFLSSDSESFYIKLNTLTSGNDQRYDANEGINSTILDKIKTHILYKNIIQQLECNDTSIHKKLSIIERNTNLYKDENRISEFNLFGGNLMNIFNDDFL
jgi:hypothetical protein